MSIVKNQIKRLGIIDDVIRNQHYPSKTEILWHLHDRTDDKYCRSVIEKDIFLLRDQYDAPIKYSKIERGYYYTDRYNLSLFFLQEWSQYFDFPKEFKQVINEIEKQSI